MPQRFPNTREHTVYIYRYDGYYRGYDYQERPEFKVECFAEFSAQKHVVAVEVYRKQYHENRNDYLQVRREASHAGIVEPESAGSCCCKRGGQRFKYRHASEEEHYEFDKRQREVNRIEYQRGGLNSWNSLLTDGPGDSSFIMCMFWAPDSGINAIINTSTPMPPTQ